MRQTCFRFLQFAIMLLAAMLLQSCSRVDPHVEGVWLRHEQAIEQALGQGTFSLNEFDSACLFFEHITGIPARVELSYLGTKPTVHTSEDLRLWREWYKENKQRLFWDNKADRVGVLD